MTFCLVLALGSGPLTYSTLLECLNTMLAGKPNDIMRAAFDDQHNVTTSADVQKFLRHSSVAYSPKIRTLPSFQQQAQLSACHVFDITSPFLL